MTAIEVYKGSVGSTTQAFYAELQKRGAIGALAVNLFRASKTSERAKVYRGRTYRGLSYDRKNWSLENICKLLAEHGDDMGIRWGWKRDPNTPGYEWVLYVDIPDFGQCSYHSAVRLCPQNYTGEWDGKKGATVQVVIDFAEWVMKLPEMEVTGTA